MTLTKIHRRLDNLTKVTKVLEAVDFDKSLTPLEESGIVKHFELAFELSWKLMKDILEYQGLTPAPAPRTIIKESLQVGIITSDEWLLLLKSRNEASHIYDEGLSHQVISHIEHHYIGLLSNFVTEITEEYGE